MRRVLHLKLVLFVCIFLSIETRAISSFHLQRYSQQPVVQNSSNQKVTYEVIRQRAGYGYNIYLSQKLFIHQPIIPAIRGKHFFISARDAATAASMVVKKIEKGDRFPSLSIAEMKAAGIVLPQ